MLKNQKLRLRMMLFNEKEDDDFPLPFALTLISSVGFNSREWHVLPRSTHWRKEHFLLAGTFLDSQFKDRFRMSRKSFFGLHALLQPHIQKQQTHFRPTIPSEHRLAIFLYHITATR